MSRMMESKELTTYDPGVHERKIGRFLLAERRKGTAAEPVTAWVLIDPCVHVAGIRSGPWNKKAQTLPLALWEGAKTK